MARANIFIDYDVCRFVEIIRCDIVRALWGMNFANKECSPSY